MEFEDQTKNLTKVWTLAIISLSYCYYVSSKLPVGIFRLFSILPIITLFFILPLYLSNAQLCGMTAFFLTWLGNSKLLLFAFDQGPLSPLPRNLLNFISIACLPIKIKQNPSSPQVKDSNFNKTTILFAIRFFLLVLVFQIHNYRHLLPRTAILALYCCHLYLQGEILLALFAISARAVLGFELEPQFNEPYLSTSLQDFWGRRWNLMVPTILRPTVYYPVRNASTPVIGPKWAQLVAVVSSFLVSGLFHELIYYYLTRVPPTWEVTWFFVLHGVCTAVETEVKRIGKWRLHRGISGPLTVAFLVVTGGWLFFPQLLRNGMIDKVISEDRRLVSSVKTQIHKILHYDFLISTYK